MSTTHLKGRKKARRAKRAAGEIPSRSEILEALRAAGRPLSVDALMKRLSVRERAERTAVEGRLRVMEGDGQVLRNRRDSYLLPAKLDMVTGRVTGHPDGYGFLIPDEGGGDLYLSSKAMRRVLHGDRVMAAVVDRDARGRRVGTIVEVLQHQNRHVVGRFMRDGGVGLVIPDDSRLSQDIVIAGGEEGDARSGQIVVAEITRQPTKRMPPAGRVSEVLGEHRAPGMEVEIAIRKYDLPHQWPDDVEREASRLPDEVRPREARGREDLRELPLVTIDGEDARDFDDAVYCEKRRGGWRLVVAIADVASYVRPGKPLDREAFERGNSVYFPDRVIPMLPEKLSNGLCSLNPDVDRLCMVCDMDLSRRGEIKRYRFYEGLMRSHARLTYTEVGAILVDGDRAARRRRRELVPHLEEAHRAFGALREARERRGSIDFELPETRIVYDDQHKIDRIEPTARNDAHKLIEEFMIGANICAAAMLLEGGDSGMFRVHEGPNADALVDLRRFLSAFGLQLEGGEKPEASDYAEVVRALQGAEERKRLVQTVLLRSLKQAVYSAENKGHFALGLSHYTHFTSPIRRYPDLVVHRLIKAMLGGSGQPDEDGALDLQRQAEHCSMTERRADDATRDAVQWLKVEYMLDKVGDVYDGTITNVTGFGIFVELEGLFVEGLVHISALGNDYYQFDPAHYLLVGERTGDRFRLGDRVTVRVVRVDLDDVKIDFDLVGHPGARGGKRRKRGPDRKSGRKGGRRSRG